MRTLYLTHGAGNGVDTACLMTASNMLIGRSADGDNNSCVCPVLRSFILPTNDAMPVELLGELYGPLAWEILGTRTNDRQVMLARGFCFADWAVREIAPIALRAVGHDEWAATLEALPPIVDFASAHHAQSVAWKIYEQARAAVEAAARAAEAAEEAAARAAEAAEEAAARAAEAAEEAAARAAEAVEAEKIWRKCPEIIRRVAAIGDRRPVECVIDADTLAKRLCSANSD